jgi:competence protein ComEC
MPAALTAMVAMPFGLEAPVLEVMGWGLSAMIAVAETVAAWPGGDGLIGRIHPLSLPLALGGLIWLCLWHERWRYLGMAPLAVALVLAPFAPRPDVLITDTGRLVAVRTVDGVLRLSGVKADRFAAGVWLAADADRRAVRQLEGEQTGVRCDPLGCTLTTAGDAPPVPGEGARIAEGTAPGTAAAQASPQPTAVPAARPRLIAHVTDAAAFEEDCQRADLVITPLVAPARCRLTTTVIDARVLAHTGALTLTWPDPIAAARATPGAPSAAAAPIATFAHPSPPRPWTPKPWLSARDTPPDDATVPPLVPHDPRTWGPVRVIDTAAQDSGRVDPTDRTEPIDDRPETINEGMGEMER